MSSWQCALRRSNIDLHEPLQLIELHRDTQSCAVYLWYTDKHIERRFLCPWSKSVFIQAQKSKLRKALNSRFGWNSALHCLPTNRCLFFKRPTNNCSTFSFHVSSDCFPFSAKFFCWSTLKDLQPTLQQKVRGKHHFHLQSPSTGLEGVDDKVAH